MKTTLSIKKSTLWHQQRDPYQYQSQCCRVSYLDLYCQRRQGEDSPVWGKVKDFIGCLDKGEVIGLIVDTNYWEKDKSEAS